MSNPSQPNPTPSGDDRDPAAPAAPVDLGFEDNLRLFWAKYSAVVLGVCAAILLAIIGWHAWEWLQARRAAARAEAFGVATTEAELKAFAADHGATALGGLAQLKLADEAFAAGRWSEALAAYEQAHEPLAGTPFAARAELGVAVAQIKNGQTAQGREALQAIAADETLTPAFRAEAAYHLASLAAAENATDEVLRLTDQITTIDPNGLWAQRAMVLRATALPAAGAEADADGATITVPLPTP